MKSSQEKRIVTPKEKQTQIQGLATKRNKFFRLLQSNDHSAYCVTASGQLQDDLRQAMSQIVKRTQATEIEEKTTEEGGRKKKGSRARTGRKLSPVKLPDLVLGLNQTFRVIESRQTSLVWI